MIDLKHLWKTRKKWIIGIGAGVLAVAAGCTAWYFLGHGGSEPVYVYPFSYLGMTEYWGDSQESYGPVTTDKIQTVFLSDTQEITQIHVAQGDTVKKGDLLLNFDTTLSDIQLERKRLDVEKLKLELQDARTRLNTINNMKPMEEPDDNKDSGKKKLGRKMEGTYEIHPKQDQPKKIAQYDGSANYRALVCWLSVDENIGQALLKQLWDTAQVYQELNKPPEPEETTEETTEETADLITESTTEATIGETQPERTLASAVEPEKDPAVHVVIRQTQNDRNLGDVMVWQGLAIVKDGDGYAFSIEDPMVSDYLVSSKSVPDTDIDIGSGYTAAEIAQMRSDQQKKIRELEFDVKMEEAEYKIMQSEMGDGNIYAKIDGEVVSLLTQQEAKQSSQPVMKVSGGGGFYVEGSVSELEKDAMQIGQEVTVSDWNTGMTYSGTIQSLGDFPANNGYYGGMGNPNASYYPFRVFVDGTADLQEGSYVSILYSAAETQNGIYLENPYLRTEKGVSYVYVKGADGRLEQRIVVTGKSLWGSYTEIRDGLTAEDLIAFPYGKNVRPGVAVVEGDLSDLYGG